MSRICDSLVPWSLEREEEQEVWYGDGKYDPIGHRKKENNRIFQRNRPFIAWDGEGITYPGNPQQCYVLFAASTGDYICAGENNSLDTISCLELLFRVETQNPDAYHIGFGFGYDVNQILNSMSRSNIYALAQCTKKGVSYKWNGYRFKIHPGKMFRVSKGNGDNFRCVTVYDTFGFFQKSFLEVVKSYFPDRLNEIESGKGNRTHFQYSDISEITRYCLSENNLLVEVMERLRGSFEERGLYLRDWHGPGAVASASLKKHKIKEAMGAVPKEVSQASQLAYQGGRFELLRAGYSDKPIWQYDINSAYPSAIVGLPDLSKGIWEYSREFEPGTFSVWHVKYTDKRTDRDDYFSRYRAQPLFYRTYDGRIAYTPKVDGWYWCPEVENLELIDYPAEIDIIEGWVYRESSDRRPFKHIEETYYERLELVKKYGKGGIERVAKLEMNSYYGKFAQRSGWFKEGDRIPSYHQLEWAGYVTSATRAKLYRAYSENPGAIFAFETDALFSTQPLELKIGKSLGDWSVTQFDNILYIQSGFYFANHSLSSGYSSDGSVSHYRGFDKGSISFDGIMEWLDKLDPWNTFSKNQSKMYGKSKRFIGFKRALMSRNPHYWRTWDTSPREISIGKDGKRVHMPGCPLCIGHSASSANSSAGSGRHSGGYKWTEGLHGLTTTIPGGISHPHRIPWTDEQWCENQWGEEATVSLADGYLC